MHKIIEKIIIERSLKTGRYLIPPKLVSLIITFNCNFQCLSCDIWQKKPSLELSNTQWSEIVDDLKQTLPPNTFIEINGGEPLLKKELTLTLIKDLKKHFKNISLNTNGSTINQEIVKQLVDAGLDSIKLSLYSQDASEHDALRGHKGAHKQAISALQYLSHADICTEIGILITSKNIAQLPSLMANLQSINNLSIVLQPLDEKVESQESKKPKDTALPTTLWPKPDEIIAFFDWLDTNTTKIKNPKQHLAAIKRYYLDPKSSLQYRCFAGQRNLVIYPNGDISFCFKKEPIGNIANRGLRNILLSTKARQMRLEINNCQKYCRIVGCNFSRGIKEWKRQ